MTRYTPLLYVIVVALATLPATAQIELEFGHLDSLGQLSWYEAPVNNHASIRVVDQNEDLGGAWVLLATRIRATATVAGLPSWLITPTAQLAGFPASTIVSSPVQAMLGSEAASALGSMSVLASPVPTQATLDLSFLVPDMLRQMGIAVPAEGDGKAYWRHNVDHWDGGLGTKLWAKTFQFDDSGLIFLNMQRVAEMAMEAQAVDVNLVNAFLASPAYADLLEVPGGGLELVVQAIVLRKPEPWYDPFILPGFDELPHVPESGDDDWMIDFSPPVTISLPLSAPDVGPGGNVESSAPGVILTGPNPTDAVIFYAGNSLQVDTAVFTPLAGGPIHQPVYPVIASMPWLGVYCCGLPCPKSALDPLAPVTLTRIATTIPGDVVVFGPSPLDWVAYGL